MTVDAPMWWIVAHLMVELGLMKSSVKVRVKVRVRVNARV